MNYFPGVVGLQPTVIASRAPHLLLEQSVMTKIRRIVDAHRPSIPGVVRFGQASKPALRSHCAAARPICYTCEPLPGSSLPPGFTYRSEKGEATREARGAQQVSRELIEPRALHMRVLLV